MDPTLFHCRFARRLGRPIVSIESYAPKEPRLRGARLPLRQKSTPTVPTSPEVAVVGSLPPLRPGSQNQPQ